MSFSDDLSDMYASDYEEWLRYNEDTDYALSDEFYDRLQEDAELKGEEDEMFINMEGDPNRQTTHGDTPLLLAINKYPIEAIERLLNNGADPNMPNDSGLTPLIKAIFNENTDVVRLLLQRGASPNGVESYDVPLIVATWFNESEVIELLLNHGAEINAQNYLGNTALMEAMMTNHPVASTIKILLNAGSNFYIENNAGESALDYDRDDLIHNFIEDVKGELGILGYALERKYPDRFEPNLLRTISRMYHHQEGTDE